MCGEHVFGAGTFFELSGSPPHVRGTQVIPKREWVDNRITPACAGNTGKAIILKSEIRDHPRMCGEHSVVSQPPLSFEGSPPHVRGTPSSALHEDCQHRITPACAGNTFKP